MEIIITKDCLATIDGFKLHDFKAGEVHDLREFCAKNLIHKGNAVRFENSLQAAFIKASLPPRPVKPVYDTPLDAALAQIERMFPAEAL